MENVVTVGASRTPMGAMQGAFSDVSAADLGGVAIAAALDGAGVPSTRVEDLLMGCVLPAGQGQAPARQAPARQAGFAAGLGQEVPATTLNKMCGSGMKAAMIAFDQIALGRPIGASGARIIMTLLNALEKRGLKRGIAAICSGGGEGTAIAIERS